jgi:hypothetical protein
MAKDFSVELGEMSDKNKPLVEVVPIESLQPDPTNANRGTERGYCMLTDSIGERGAARSIWVTSDGVVKGGNKTHQAAVDTGIEDVILVHTDGSQLVAVVRDDLAQGDPVADRLAIEDNRIGQESLEFDPAVLLEMGKRDETLTEGLWRNDEWEELLGEMIEAVEFPEYDESIADDVKYITCPKCGEVWPA